MVERDPLQETASEAGYEALGAAEYDVDLVTGEVVHSPRLNALLGIPAAARPTLDDLLGHWHPDDLVDGKSTLRQLVEAGERRFVRDVRIVRADGSERWLRAGSEVVHGGDGQPKGLHGIAVDITESTLREAQQVFMLDLSDALRVSADPQEIQNKAAQMVAEHLRADRLGGPDRSASRLALEALPGVLEPGRLVIEDVTTDRSLGSPLRDTLERLGGAAFAVVTRARGDGSSEVFGVSSATPRTWTQPEIALVSDVAERAWLASDRAVAELRLRSTTRQLLLALEAARMATWFRDEDGDATSPTFGDVFGLPAGDTWQSDRSALALLHPHDRVRHMELMESSIGRGQGWHDEFRIVRPRDGSIAWLEERVTAERDEVTGTLRLAGVVWDITERKQAELSQTLLADVTERLTPLQDVDAAMGAVASDIATFLGVDRCNFAEIDEESDTAVITHEWAATGLPRIAGDTVYRLGDFISDEFYELARNGEVIVVDDTVADPRTEDAAYRQIDTRAFITANYVRDGRWRFLMGVSARTPRAWRADEVRLLRELTSRIWLRLERARVEAASSAEREQREQLEREFVANAAHELRTPLASIVASVDALEAGALEEEVMRTRFFGHIKRESDRMARLCESLLLLARMDRSERLPRESVVVQALLERVARQLSAPAEVRVDVDAQADLTVVTTPGLLELIVANLADNAAKRTRAGSVVLSATRSGGEVVIEVADSGPGITLEVAAHAFERFYRGGPRTGDGFGLGLAIAADAARAIGGGLTLEPRPEGGTLGRLTLREGE